MVENKAEGASQTFAAGAPVKTVAGLIVEAADPVVTLYGIAVRPGQNLALPTVEAEVVPITAGVSFWANFTADPTGTTAFAAADMDAMGSVRETVAGGIWYVKDDAGVADVCVMMGNKSDYTPPNVAPAAIAVGDLNVRAEFVFLPSVAELQN